MPVPISGDKILAQRDTNTSRSEQQARKAEAPNVGKEKTAAPDSVSLSNAAATDSIRPLSENIRSPEEAQSRLQNLLGSLRDNPQTGMRAQANLSQSQAEALLHAPA